MEIKYDETYKIFSGTKEKGKRRIERKLIIYLLFYTFIMIPFNSINCTKAFFGLLYLLNFYTSCHTSRVCAYKVILLFLPFTLDNDQSCVRNCVEKNSAIASCLMSANLSPIF